MSGNKLVIGAPGNDPGSSTRGAAYLYEISTIMVDTIGTLLPQPNLLQSVASPNNQDDFGASVAIAQVGDGSGAQVVWAVGAPDDNTGGGKVFVYDRNAVLTQVLDPRLDVLAGGEEGHDDATMFGFDVALTPDGLSLAVGAPEHADMKGRVRAYRKAAFAVAQEQAFEVVHITEEIQISDRVTMRSAETTLPTRDGSGSVVLVSYPLSKVRSVKYLITGEDDSGMQTTEVVAMIRRRGSHITQSATHTLTGSSALYTATAEREGDAVVMRVTTTGGATHVLFVTTVATAMLK